MNGQKAGFRSGFTLMELLVVIAIIALLVSILMPSLQAAKALARQAVCQSTLHTMALANGMYMNDYNGFSVHGREMSSWWHDTGPDTFVTGYDLPLRATDYFDDDFRSQKKGQPYDSSGTQPSNIMNKGRQNICHVGQLMYDRYLEESAGAIGCPQADFDKVTPMTVQGYTASYQDVVKYMAKPRIDPNNPGGLDPNDYWRNDIFNGLGSFNQEARSNYAVRGPMFRPGDVLYMDNVTWHVPNFPSDARSKPDPEIALFGDFERQSSQITSVFLGYSGADFDMDFPDPPMPSVGGKLAKGWTHWPKRHTPGVNTAYIDGHVALFPDETRKKTFRRNAADQGGRNETVHYGNSYALMTHVYDSGE